MFACLYCSIQPFTWQIGIRDSEWETSSHPLKEEFISTSLTFHDNNEDKNSETLVDKENQGHRWL